VQFVRLLTAATLAIPLSASAQSVPPAGDRVEQWKQRLQSDPVTERLRLLNEGSEGSSPDAAATLRGILDNRREPPLLREAAAARLLKLEREATARRLRAIADDTREDPRGVEGLRLLAIRTSADRPDFGGVGLLARLATNPTAGDAVRTEAVSALAFVAPEGFDEPLRVVAQDATAPVRARIAAARGLGRIGSVEVVDILVPLTGEGSEVSAAAAAALAELTRRAGPWSPTRSVLILDALRNLYVRSPERTQTRLDALTAIGQVGHPAGVDFLREAAERDPVIEARVAAVTALGSLEHVAALVSLTALAEPPSVPERVRVMAFKRLCVIGARLKAGDEVVRVARRRLDKGTDQERQAAVECLGWLGDASAIPLLWMVADDPRVPVAVRALAISGLRNKNPEVEEVRRRLRTTSDSALRAPLADLFAGTPGSHFWEIARLMDTEKAAEPVEVRLGALTGLRRRRLDGSALTTVIAVFLRERDDRVRGGLLSVLAANAGEPSARDQLKVFLEDQKNDRHARLAAAQALIGAFPERVDPGRLAAEEAGLRRILSFAADGGQLQEIRRILIAQLERFTGPAILPQFSSAVKTDLVGIASNMSEVAEIRTVAIRALALSLKAGGDVELVRQLAEVVRSKSDAADVRIGGIRAIAAAATPQVAQTLRRIATDTLDVPDVRSAAVSALADGFADDSDVRLMIRELAANRQNDNAEVRDAAVFALGLLARDAADLIPLSGIIYATDSDESARVSAVAGLAINKRPDSRPLVSAAATDRSALVRWAARLGTTRP
jgi:HEAT repeat protein